MNVGLSVSRVGGAAQTKAMKKVAGRLRLDLAQFRELAAFAQFGTSDLDAATRRQLERGQRITEILKQPQYAPVSVEQQVMIIFAAINGYMDDIPVNKVLEFETGFHKFMQTNHPEIGGKVAETKDLPDDLTESLGKAIEEYKQTAAF